MHVSPAQDQQGPARSRRADCPEVVYTKRIVGPFKAAFPEEIFFANPQLCSAQAMHRMLRRRC
jgi:hypothetical protein